MASPPKLMDPLAAAAAARRPKFTTKTAATVLLPKPTPIKAAPGSHLSAVLGAGRDDRPLAEWNRIRWSRLCDGLQGDVTSVPTLQKLSKTVFVSPSSVTWSRRRRRSHRRPSPPRGERESDEE